MRYLLPIGVFIFAVMIFTSQISTILPAYGEINHIEFRLVLDQEEMGDKECDTIIKGDETLNIWKPYFLRDNDISETLIFRSATIEGRFMVGFSFNETGKNNLTTIMKKFPSHRIAIFANGAFVTVLPAQFMNSFSDTLVIIWPRKEDELRLIARNINKKPESILSLYIDETVKYNDVAADEWAKIYQNVSTALEKSNKKRDFEKNK